MTLRVPAGRRPRETRHDCGVGEIVVVTGADLPIGRRVVAAALALETLKVLNSSSPRLLSTILDWRHLLLGRHESS